VRAEAVRQKLLDSEHQIYVLRSEPFDQSEPSLSQYLYLLFVRPEVMSLDLRSVESRHGS
jgi:hypothetical protein